MQFKYTPEGAEPKVWDFDPDKLMSPEAEAIERNTGMTYGEWGTAVTKGSILAIHGLLFVLLKREMPTLKWDEVQFCTAEVDFEPSEQEKAVAKAELLEKAKRGEPLSEDDVALLEQLGGVPEPELEADGTPKD